jgi:hypothetical protein
MSVDWLEMAQKLAAGVRAKADEDRRRLEALQMERNDKRGPTELPAPPGEPPGPDGSRWPNGHHLP